MRDMPSSTAITAATVTFTPMHRQRGPARKPLDREIYALAKRLDPTARPASGRALNDATNSAFFATAHQRLEAGQLRLRRADHRP
jgi:hypothetical protein